VIEESAKPVSKIKNLAYAVITVLMFWFFQMVFHAFAIGMYWLFGKIGFGAINEFKIETVPLWILLTAAGGSSFFGLFASYQLMQMIAGINWDKRPAVILLFVTLLPLVIYSLMRFSTWSSALPSLVLSGVAIITLPEYWKRPGFSV